MLLDYVFLTRCWKHVYFLMLKTEDGDRRQAVVGLELSKKPAKTTWNCCLGLCRHTGAPSGTPKLWQQCSSMAVLAVEHPVQAQLGFWISASPRSDVLHSQHTQQPPLAAKKRNHTFIMASFAITE